MYRCICVYMCIYIYIYHIASTPSEAIASTYFVCI